VANSRKNIKAIDNIGRTLFVLKKDNFFVCSYVSARKETGISSTPIYRRFETSNLSENP
jgi:hypothetical protein